MYYIHYLSSKQVMICFYKHNENFTKLHKGQTQSGKRVEVTDTFTKEQITDYSEKGYVFQNKGQLLLILL